jgi:MoaA/NifB/PqqE/SkfB family radical SAM enzyme
MAFYMDHQNKYLQKEKMTHNRQIAFGYSTKCNLKCDHCVASNDSIPHGKMERDKAAVIITEMARHKVTGISFTAGEPLLYPDDICHLVGLCNRLGIYSRVVTNGYWAKTGAQSDTMVSQLLQSGLSQLRISFSRWHQKQIPPETIANAALSCIKYGLDYFISFVTDFSKQDDPLEHFLRDNNLKFFPEPLIYFGRAEGFNTHRILTDYQPNTCALNPYISPGLDMFACCDAGAYFTKTGFFYLGNHKNLPMETLFQKKENNDLYNLITTMGLTNIASFLGFRARDIVTYRKCEMCEKIFNSTETLARLKTMAKSELLTWKR